MCDRDKNNILIHTQRTFKNLGFALHSRPKISFGIKACAFAVLSFLLIFAGYTRQTFANGEVGFSVRAVQSDRQIDKNVSYFDLRLSPGEEHVLEIDILNASGNPMKAAIGAYTAGTNSGGVIEYDNPNTDDDSLIVSLSEIAEVEQPIITIPASASGRVKVKLSMPGETYDGIVLGGISVKKLREENPDTENSGGTSVQNEYGYVIGVRISENDNPVEPDFRLRHVEPTLSSYSASIAANLQNFKAAAVKGLAINAAIYYGNETEPLYSKSDDDFDVAPNSNFNFIVPCKERLRAGDYKLLLTAVLGERIWEFEERFTITATEANDINNEAINVPKKGIDYYFIATICLSLILVALIAIIIILVFKKRKNKNEKNGR